MTNDAGVFVRTCSCGHEFFSIQRSVCATWIEGSASGITIAGMFLHRLKIG